MAYRIDFENGEWFLCQGDFHGSPMTSKTELIERIEEEIEEITEEFESFDAEDQEAEREDYQKSLEDLRKLAEMQRG